MSAAKCTEKAKFVIMKKVTLQADDSSGDEADLSSPESAVTAKLNPKTAKPASMREPAAKEPKQPAIKKTTLTKTAKEAAIKDTTVQASNSKCQQPATENWAAVAAQYQELNRDFAIKCDFLKQEIAFKDSKIGQLDQENFQLREYVVRLEEELKRLRDENYTIQSEYLESREELGQLKERYEALELVKSDKQATVVATAVDKLPAPASRKSIGLKATTSRALDDLNSMSILMSDNVNDTSVLGAESRSSTDPSESFYSILPMLETMKTQFQTQFALFKNIYQHARPFISQHQMHLKRPSLLLNAPRKSLANETVMNCTGQQDEDSTRSSLSDTHPTAVITPESMRRLADNVRAQKEQMEQRAREELGKQQTKKVPVAMVPVTQMIYEDEVEEEEEEQEDEEEDEEDEEVMDEEQDDDDEQEMDEEQEEMETSVREAAYDINQAEDAKQGGELTDGQTGLAAIEEETSQMSETEQDEIKNPFKPAADKADTNDDASETNRSRRSSEDQVDQSGSDRRSLVAKKNVTFDEAGPTFSDPKLGCPPLDCLPPSRTNGEVNRLQLPTSNAVRAKPPIGKPVEITKKPILKVQQPPAAPEPFLLEIEATNETVPAAPESRKSTSRKSSCGRRRSMAFSIGPTTNNGENPILNPSEEMLETNAATLIDETALIIPMTQPAVDADDLDSQNSDREGENVVHQGFSNVSINAQKPKAIFKSKQIQQEPPSDATFTVGPNSDDNIKPTSEPCLAKKAIADYLGDMDDEEGKKKEGKEKKKAPSKAKEKPAEAEDDKKAKSRKEVRTKIAAPEEPSSQPESEDSGSQSEASGAKSDRLAKRTIDSLYENTTDNTQAVNVPALTVTLDSTLEISSNNSSNNEGLVSPAPIATSNPLQVVIPNNNNNTNNSSHNNSNSYLSPAGKSCDSGDANDSLSKKIKLSPDTLSEAAGRRRHKLVSYKEPSLNCKMRRDKENKVIIKAPK